MNSSKKNLQNRTILPIQYLRGFAALMVVWHHSIGQIYGLDGYFAKDFGPEGVDLFFVISGFIMIATTRGSNIGIAEFTRRRITRVVPLYWSLTLIMSAIALIKPSLFKTLIVTPITLIKSLFFIPHYSISFPGNIFPLLVPGWTLNLEVFFYLIVALSLFLPMQKRLFAIVATLLVLVLTGGILGPFKSAIAQTYTDVRMLEFAAGGLVAWAWHEKLFRLPFLVSIGALIVGVMLLTLGAKLNFGQFPTAIGATVIIIAALDSRLGKINCRILKLLGDSSYSVYLTHIFTLGVLRVIWANFGPSVLNFYSALLFMLLGLFFCSVIGCFSYQWFEKPLIKRLTKNRSSISMAASLK